MISRRNVLAGMTCSCISNPGLSAGDDPSCIFFNAGGAPSRDFPGISRIVYGEDISNALVILIAKMSELFGVNVGVGYYDDPYDLPNAGASPDAVMADIVGNSRTFRGNSEADGTIGIGRHLVEQIREQSASFGAALTAIIAHEYGHILQFKYLASQLMKLDYNYKLTAELHADFVCGYVAAFRKLEQPNYPAVIQADTQFRRGDDGSVRLIEHGTPDQRGECVLGGFLLGQKGRIDPREVAIKGFEFVKGVVK
jgi:hypothetical protein